MTLKGDVIIRSDFTIFEIIIKKWSPSPHEKRIGIHFVNLKENIDCFFFNSYKLNIFYTKYNTNEKPLRRSV